jgi:predicted GNAT superfamily acetyltransferase
VKAISVLFVILLTPGLSAPAQIRSSSPADESKLIALENAWNQAQLHHDAKALDSLVGEKFIYTDTDGSVMNKTQFLVDLKDPDYRASLIANENVKVYLYPNAAVVAGKYHTKGTYKGKRFEHWGRFTDTWIYENGLWQCVASHTNLIQK